MEKVKTDADFSIVTAMKTPSLDCSSPHSNRGEGGYHQKAQRQMMIQASVVYNTNSDYFNLLKLKLKKIKTRKIQFANIEITIYSRWPRFSRDAHGTIRPDRKTLGSGSPSSSPSGRYHSVPRG